MFSVVISFSLEPLAVEPVDDDDDPQAVRPAMAITAVTAMHARPAVRL
jgi:hypothetical protein